MICKMPFLKYGIYSYIDKSDIKYELRHPSWIGIDYLGLKLPPYVIAQVVSSLF